ncbi:hypothetical protein WJR50_31520 [Catalinimonas sp. 4WD22]|uniref:hypothetical protein n=1 Tax=Catalinimonas locisalis TaxID=3133978 RepID=UPI0031019D00
MRNINKFKTACKDNQQKHGKFSSKSYGIGRKIEEVKIRVRNLLGQVFANFPSRKMQLQPIPERKTGKPTLLLALSALMAAALFTNCSTTVPKADTTQEQQLDKAGANDDYQAIIGDYRNTKAENLSVYNQDSVMFQTVMMADLSTENQQTIDSLKQQQSVMKMKIDSFQDKGEESWRAFKAELNQDIDAMKKTLNDSTEINVQ